MLVFIGMIGWALLTAMHRRNWGWRAVRRRVWAAVEEGARVCFGLFAICGSPDAPYGSRPADNCDGCDAVGRCLKLCGLARNAVIGGLLFGFWRRCWRAAAGNRLDVPRREGGVHYWWVSSAMSSVRPSGLLLG